MFPFLISFFSLHVFKKAGFLSFNRIAKLWKSLLVAVRQDLKRKKLVSDPEVYY